MVCKPSSWTVSSFLQIAALIAVGYYTAQFVSAPSLRSFLSIPTSTPPSAQLTRPTDPASGWANTNISTASQGKLWTPTPTRQYDAPRRIERNTSQTRAQAHAPVSFRMCEQWAVITSIFPPTKVMNQLRDMHQWCLVVVGDVRTDDVVWKLFAESASNTVYLSAEAQELLGYSITKYLPWGHFGRKNIGYLYAIHHGAQLIWDTDDDNELQFPEYLQQLAELADDQDRSVPVAYSEHHLWNPYPHFRPIEPRRAKEVDLCWPRGFPLEFLQDSTTLVADMSVEVPIRRIGVFQSLANHDPDVDALYRLTKQLPLSFLDNSSYVALPAGRVAPFNAQATLWTKRAFWGILLPVSVHGRVSDIWRSYFTQRVMQELGLLTAFSWPIVKQERNVHALMADLQAEVPLYTQARELVKWLREWKRTGNGVAEWVDELTIDLYEIEIMEKNDVLLQQAWFDDLEAMGYTMPEADWNGSVKEKTSEDVTGKAKETVRAPPKTNVAVCVSGQIRTLGMAIEDPNHAKGWLPMRSTLPDPNMTVAESIQKNLFPKLGNPDVFMMVSTRETESEPKVNDKTACEPLRPPNGHLTCEVNAEKTVPIYNVDMWKHFRLYNHPDKVSKGDAMIQGLLQQLKGMYECHRSIEQYSLRTGKKYDWMVRLRPDEYVHSFPDLETLALAAAQPTIFHGSFKACCCGNYDQFAIARADWMRRYFDRFLFIQQIGWTPPESFSAERFLKIYLNLFNIKLEEHSEIELCIIKPLDRVTRSQP